MNAERTTGALHKAFWHGSPDELQSYRYYRHAYLWTQYVGRFKVQTWTDRDGKPIATGWFLLEKGETA